MSEQSENVVFNTYKSLLRKRCEVLSMKDERTHLVDQINDFQESLNVKYGAFLHLPSELDEEKVRLLENIDLLQFDEQLSMNTFNATKKSYDGKVYEQTMYLRTKRAEVASKGEELDNFKQEMVCLKQEMHQKKTQISDFHRKMTVETVLVEQQRTTFNELTSSDESKAKHFKFDQEHKRLQNESSELNEVINLKKDWNINIRKRNTALSEESAAIEAQCRYKLLDVDKMRCKENYNETVCTQAEEKNYKIMRKIEITLHKQENEIVGLEVLIAKQRATNEILKITNDELVDQINSELGQIESLEDKLLLAETDLSILTTDCDTLNNVLIVESNMKAENDNKLKKFQAMEAKLLNAAQSKLFDDLEKQSQKKQQPQIQEFKLPERSNKRVLSDESNKRIFADAVRADGREHVFPQPMMSRRKVLTPRKLKKKRQSPRTINEPIIQSADSSVSELWDTSFNEAEENVMDNAGQRHLHSLKLLREFLA